MATVIKPKRSETASSVPTTGNLSVGEMAVNTADQKIYVRDSADNIVVVADSAAAAAGISDVVEDTTPQLGGDLDLNSSDITGTGDINITGTVTATSYAGDGSSLTGISAGATGGGDDQVFYENDQTVDTNYTITTNKNAMTAGPITVSSGVSVTVPSGSTWTIV